ncbi:endolytic transglycosylase MltG [Streptomyces pathocidini]|uniref:Endolytic murein transglycosylase n=1 Tax=Streptomyces pathocidini TaxID=1650571 RepID=A0ABW7UTK8_9ACTN|nr:endolytic transglycosylase MltG [Streptomyces pathocidini]
MTEYGPGRGPEPWHPDDPLYGEPGWDGQQHYPQQPHWDAAPDTYATGQHQYTEPYHPDQQGYGWDPSQTGATAAYGPGEVYGQQPQDPYAGERPDLYGTPDAYPPPQPPNNRGPQHQPYDTGTHPVQGQPYAQQQPAEWAGEPEPETHPFFTDAPGQRGDDDGYEDEPASGGRRGDKRNRPKRRSGTACLVAGVILVGVVGGVGYLGYDMWQERFGPAPDFSGSGTGEVQVEIPDGATGNQIGNILKTEGVVKSVDAFVAAQNANPKGNSIQPGVYILRKQMAAAEAVEMMTDPKNLNALIIAEGLRDASVYSAIDKKLGVPAGTTKDVAKKQVKNLGLPDWADDNPKIKDPLEGFLFPSRYSAAKGTKPEDVLRQMVERATKVYEKAGVEAAARKLGLDSPLQVVTVASLIQAEGKTHDDFKKMAAVVYNRLEPGNTETNGKLEFDSTYNYLKNQSNINIGIDEIRNHDDPYNTYFYRGLPPGPIGNPGEEALAAAMKPDKGDWFYFVSTDGNKTEFAKTLAEHNKLVEKFNENQRKKQGN